MRNSKSTEMFQRQESAGVSRRSLLSSVVASALLLPATGAKSEDRYPDRPVRVVLGYAPGGGADILARYYADKLQDLAKIPFIVVNRTGAAGNIGANFASKAKPDGYTILLAPNVAFLGNVHAFKNPGYHPLKDFDPVATFAILPFVIAVGPDSPINSIDDLKRHVLEKAGKATYGGTTTTAIMATELLLAQFGGSATRVPYKSMGDSVADLGWKLDFVIADGTFAAGQARAGRMKLLAVTTAKRSAAMPDLPTVQEAGFPGFDIAAWWAAYVPKGAPPDIVKKLEGMFDKVTRSPETRTFLAKVATDAYPNSAERLGEIMKIETKKWGELLEKAGIEKQ